MPKRILDGEAMWGSHKIASMEPAWVRAEYPWWHSLAGANGVFELDLRAIWAKCYAYARPDKSLEDLRVIQDAFIQAKLLFTWEQNGKTWGYWVGSDKPGLLPRKSWRDREAKNGKLAPEPPEEELRRFLSSADDAQQVLALEPARHSRVADTPEACNLHGTSVPGFGFGSGSGIGSGVGKEGAPQDGAPVAQAKPRPSPSAFTGTHLRVSPTQDKLLAEAFPWVDRPAEYRRADSWIEANPNRRPKRTGPFLHNWFSKIPAPSASGSALNGGGSGARGPDRVVERQQRTDAALARVLGRT